MPQPKYPPPRDPGWIDIPEVLRILGISRRTLYNYRDGPDFPEPVATEGKALLYSRQAILDWKQRRQPKE